MFQDIEFEEQLVNALSVVNINMNLWSTYTELDLF